MSFQIEKREVSVTLHFSDGVQRDGVLFLGQTSSFRKGPETVLDLLRDKDPCFPFRDRDGGFRVVRKAAITHVRHADLRANELDVGDEVAVAVVFVGNATLSGMLRISLRMDQVRLVDFMNSSTGFVELVGRADHFVVNTALIREIGPATAA